jgi:pimeloyl-ACP methyl ester carboxylesterase
MNLKKIQLRIHGSSDLPTLIYLPGLHGDWTLVSSFRAAVRGKLRFVEFAYPCRCDWSLPDYAWHISEALEQNGISEGWLLAESFSSQVAWKLLERGEPKAFGFTPIGLILAGGFVKHPVIPGVHGFHALHRLMPWWMCRLFLKLYAAYARLRHRHAPETLASIGEFVLRRTPEDREAIASRYPLIANNDLRCIAGSVRLPVFALSGFFDPIVPWPLVLPWLHSNCPGFRGSHVIFNADHNVLGTAPAKAAAQVLSWIDSANSARPKSRDNVSGWKSFCFPVTCRDERSFRADGENRDTPRAPGTSV